MLRVFEPRLALPLLLSLLVTAAGCGSESQPPGTTTTTGSGGSGGTGGSGTNPTGCDAVDLAPFVTGGTWDPGFTVAGFSGHDGLGPGVYDLARAPNGDVVAVGRFQYIGDKRVAPIARLQGGTWKGDAEAALPSDQAGVSAVAVDAQGLVAVATYSTLPFDLQQRDGEIWVDDGQGFKKKGTFHGAIRAMAYFGGELWVGGIYALDGGEGAPGLSVLGASGWKAPPGGALVGDGVFELTADATSLLVGGTFTDVGGIAAQSVASWDGNAWSALDLGQEGSVFALARDAQGDIYAGGLFSIEGSFETGGVARWNGATWESVGGGLANPTFRGVVSDLALHQGAIYASGCFTSAGGVPSDPKAIAARSLVRWSGTKWEAVADGDPVVSGWFSPLSCGDEGPAAIWDAEQQRLLSDGTRLYVGGFFPGLGGVPSQSIIAYESGKWTAQGTPGDGLSGAARALAAGGPDCTLHAMGGFSHAGKVAAQGGVVRHDDKGGWVRVGPDLPDKTYCWTMAVDAEGAPLLGCDLTQNEADPPVGVVYRLKQDAWATVGNPFADGGVAAMGFDPSGVLWVAGGGAKGFVASATADAFRTVGAFDARVGSIAFQPRKSAEDPIRAVAGGYFTTVDGKPAMGVAHWNGSAWEALGDGFAGGVLAVAYAADGSIYASTPDDGTMNRMILGRWDGSAWHEVATPEPGPTEAGYMFYALLARGSYVVAAGFAWPGSDERNVFVYDGTKFQSLHGGATAISVDTMALSGSGLWLGGAIAEVGPPASRIPSVGVARLR